MPLKTRPPTMSGTRAVRSASQPKAGSPTSRAAGQAATTRPRVARSTPWSRKYSGRTGQQRPEADPDDELGPEQRQDRSPRGEPSGEAGAEVGRSSWAGIGGCSRCGRGGGVARRPGASVAARAIASRPARRDVRPYHRAMPIEILIVVLVVAAVVVAVPVRRLLARRLLGLDDRRRTCALIGLLAVGVTEARPLGRVPPADPRPGLHRPVHHARWRPRPAARPAAARSSG